MVTIVREPSFEKKIRHLRDRKLMERVKKQIRKILDDPEKTGIPLRHNRKNEKKIYIPPYRLIFAYDRKIDTIYLIDFGKRDRVYKK